MAKRKNKKDSNDAIGWIALCGVALVYSGIEWLVERIGWVGFIALIFIFIALIIWIISAIRRIRLKKQCFAGIRSKLLKSYSSGIFDFDNMSGTGFEDFCCKVLGYNGYYDIKTTKASGDFGVDIICKHAGIQYAVQCKRYLDKVGVDAVQQVDSGSRYYRCQSSMVMTNSYFTNAAIELANANGVELIDRDDLNHLISKRFGGKSLDDAGEIVSLYNVLLRSVYRLPVNICRYKTDFERINISMEIEGNANALMRKIDEMNKFIGYRHNVECGGKNTRLTVTNS